MRRTSTRQMRYSFSTCSPAHPIPQLRHNPNVRPPQKNISRGISADFYLAAALHSGAQSAVGVGNRYARIKNGCFVNALSFLADEQNLSAKRARRVAVQFHGCGLSSAEQSGLVIIDSDIDDHSRRVHDFREGVAESELAAGERIDARRCDDSIDRRAEFRLVEDFLRSR